MNRKKTGRSVPAAAALTLITIIFILSASVAVPLLWRGFFYLHVRMLNMTDFLPWTYGEICEAFDEMMDFCILGGDFSTGVLRWSEEGMKHFADCRVLFRLDLIMFAVTGAILAAVFIYVFSDIRRCGFFSILTSAMTTGPLGRGPFFWAGIIPSAGFMTLGLIIWAAGFDRAFVVFHKLFFPGKDNWIFDPAVDEIINVLPEQFFLDCAVLIAVFILLWSAVFIVADLRLCRRRKVEL